MRSQTLQANLQPRAMTAVLMLCAGLVLGLSARAADTPMSQLCAATPGSAQCVQGLKPVVSAPSVKSAPELAAPSPAHSDAKKVKPLPVRTERQRGAQPAVEQPDYERDLWRHMGVG